MGGDFRSVLWHAVLVPRSVTTDERPGGDSGTPYVSKSNQVLPGLLLWLLRLFGVTTLAATEAIVMPYDWMNLIHQRLGMGELPHLPIVEYLTRSISALYALHGALILFVSLDVHRYLPIVRVLGWAGVVMGVLLVGLDRAVGMPVLWTIGEGPSVPVSCAVILLLDWRVRLSDEAAAYLRRKG